MPGQPRAAAALAGETPETLVAVVLSHAEEQPDRTFVEVWDQEHGVMQRATFAQFANQMLAGAHWLRVTAALEPEDYCAFLAHNSIAYLALSFGAMALGATSVNLNWRNSLSVTTVLVKDLKPRVLLASRPFKDDANSINRQLGTQIVLIESICDARPDQLPFPILPEFCAEYDAIATNSPEVVGPSTIAAVFFTGGTTGTPKAVPHTHAGLIWVARELYKQCPEPFAETVDNRGTICFTPYFHVMGFVANTVFNLVTGCRAALLASHEAKLSPSLMLAAIRDLRPSCVNTVPWVVEGLTAMMTDGNDDTSSALSRLHLITYGGAPLAPHCPPIMRKHGVVVACTYGQTELAGPVMYGKPDGDPNALRPFGGVRFELVRGPEDAENEGELVLIGNGSATPGYLTLSSETREYRSLTGKDAKLTTERFCTGDRFARVTLDGQEGEWLLYRCRQDDLLVHTSGEMTNPLPIEQQFQAACPSLCSLACCVGDGLTQPLLIVELASVSVDANDSSTRSQLLHALEAANRDQPAYSHVKPQHVLLVAPEGLPRTVKGSAQRGATSKQYAAELEAALKMEGMLPTLAEKSVALQFDSLATSTKDDKSSSSADAPDPSLTHLTGILGLGALFVSWAHTLVPQIHSLKSGDNFLQSEMTDAQGSEHWFKWHPSTLYLASVIDMLAGVSLCFFLTIIGMVSQFSINQDTLSSFRHLFRFYASRLGRVIISTLISLCVGAGMNKFQKDCVTEHKLHNKIMTLTNSGFIWWRGPLAGLVASLGLIACHHAHMNEKIKVPQWATLLVCAGTFGGGTVALLWVFFEASPDLLSCFGSVTIIDVILRPSTTICPSPAYWFIGEMIIFILIHPAVSLLLSVLDKKVGLPGLIILQMALIGFASAAWSVEKWWQNRRTITSELIDYGTFLEGAVLATLTRSIARHLPQLTQRGSQLRMIVGTLADLALLSTAIFALVLPPIPNFGGSVLSSHFFHERVVAAPVAVFLLCSGVTHGAGLAARALRNSVLAIIGQVALEIYVLSIGWEFVFGLLGLYGPGELQCMYKAELLGGQSVILFMLSLLWAAHALANYVVQPIISRTGL